MIRALAAATGLALAAGLVHANVFYLKDGETGKTHGPFQMRNGAPVALGEKTYAVVVPAAERTPSIQQRLTRTVIPQLDFRTAAVSDIVEYLRKAAVEHSPYREDRHKSVNIILNLPPDAIRRLPPITLSARDLTLMDAIKAVCGAANLQYVIEPRWVTIKAKP